MEGKWKVIHTYACGTTIIQVARMRDVNEVMHSGNLESYPHAFETDEEAQKIADQLNEREEHWRSAR